jgi:hypothetical protein
MADNTIEVAITSENLMNLKRAITVIKDAYKKSASQQVTGNEAALYPLLLPQLNNLKADIEATTSSLNSYSTLTLDQLGKGQDLDLNSISDVDKATGNYPITPELIKDAKNTVNTILGDTSGRKSLATTDQQGGVFGNTNVTSTQQVSAERENTAPFFDGVSSDVYNNKYANKKSGSLLKECIPCDLRLSSVDGIDPMGDLLGMLEQDLLNRYRRLLDRFKALLSNNEVYNDLCSLLNFLNFQCLPDLYGIVALLSALAMKLTDIKLINPTGAFMSFITPFFAPMLNGLNDILDKYIQLIIRPVNCVLNSIDTQLAKLDVGRALDQTSRARQTQILTKISFLERKASSLIERRNFLLETNDAGDFVNNVNSYKITGANRDIQTGEAETLNVSASIGKFYSREEEIQNIDDELREIVGPSGNDGQIAELRNEYNSLKKSQPTANAITGARGGIADFRNSIGTSLESIRDYILDGRRMIMDTAEVWKKELQRTLFGRAASTDEMLQAAEDLQKIARIIGIVNTMIQFSNLAKSGKLCNNNTNDPSAALGSFLTAASASTNSSNAPVVALGTDENGNQIMLVTSSDAVLELEGENQTQKLDNLAQLNMSGQAADLGSLASVNIKATSSLGNAPVSIAKFNLCGEVSASTSQSLDIIKSWASNVGN